MKLSVWLIVVVSVFREIDAQACCPDSWIAYQEHCYYVGADSRTFMEAHNFCTQKGANLVRIEDYSENQFLKDLLRNFRVSNVWIGLNDMRSEGTYRWYGSNVRVRSFSDWAAGTPHSNGGEDCVTLWKDWEYRWNDAPCSNRYRPICEK